MFNRFLALGAILVSLIPGLAAADAILTASDVGNLCKAANIWNGAAQCVEGLTDARNVSIVDDSLLSPDAAEKREARVLGVIKKSAAGSIIAIDTLYTACMNVGGDFSRHGCRMSRIEGSAILVIPREYITDKVRAAMEERHARTIDTFGERRR